MKVHKVEITLTGVAMIRAETEQEATALARQELKGKVIVLDQSQELVYAGPLGAARRPKVALSPTTMVVRTDGEAVLVHKS